jgi:flagellin
VSASSGTMGSTDRAAQNTEFEALGNEISRISANTQWNGSALFAAGSASATTFQVGANASQTIQVTFNNFDAGSFTGTAGDAGNTNTNANSKFVALDTDGGTTDLKLSQMDLLDVATATKAIYALDEAITNVNTERATYGATINRLEYASDNLANVSQNTSASRSRILDADYASETTELARTQIIQQAGTAMLSQANQQAQSVLALLK